MAIFLQGAARVTNILPPGSKSSFTHSEGFISLEDSLTKTTDRTPIGK
jgi:hypothetical protein